MLALTIKHSVCTERILISKNGLTLIIDTGFDFLFNVVGITL